MITVNGTRVGRTGFSNMAGVSSVQGVTGAVVFTGASVSGQTVTIATSVVAGITIAGTAGSTLNVGTGGTLGTGAYADISKYAPLNAPTFTGEVTCGGGGIQITETGFVTGAGATLDVIAGTLEMQGGLTCVCGDEITGNLNDGSALASLIGILVSRLGLTDSTS